MDPKPTATLMCTLAGRFPSTYVQSPPLLLTSPSVVNVCIPQSMNRNIPTSTSKKKGDERVKGEGWE